ncbi:MAG: 4-oxalocrotonate tautomerase family protein [archaeon]|nr:4-oxalocrotonate tautomerase family protein [archaeon]MCP8305911.1 4-oxalocrotonate tautomerase family protein [archaeon]
MPLVDIWLGKGALSDEEKKKLASSVTDVIVKEAKQPKQFTWVLIHEIPPNDWMVGGLTVPELKKQMQEKK